jgi:hypothetical protein
MVDGSKVPAFSVGAVVASEDYPVTAMVRLLCFSNSFGARPSLMHPSHTIYLFPEQRCNVHTYIFNNLRRKRIDLRVGRSDSLFLFLVFHDVHGTTS